MQTLFQRLQFTLRRFCTPLAVFRSLFSLPNGLAKRSQLRLPGASWDCRAAISSMFCDFSASRPLVGVGAEHVGQQLLDRLAEL